MSSCTDILATRELLEAARPDDVGVSVAYPLPGTKFYEQVKGQFLNGKTHWQDSGDLAMMFRGTYSSDFYRAIRNLLHEQVTDRASWIARASARVTGRRSGASRAAGPRCSHGSGITACAA